MDTINNRLIGITKQSLPYLILLATFLAYSSGLTNDFINWDDEVYVSMNTDIKQANFTNFFTKPYNGTYVPLTMCTWALEYIIFGLNSFPFILINIMLHLACTLMAFFLVKRWTGNYIISIIGMLIFGLHPIHVESVIWITERKDVLYTFFLFLALIQYDNHLSKIRPGRSITKNYYYTLLFFLLSLLAKGQAVVLPVLLLCVDYLYGRKIISRNTIIEKIPFFIISLSFGLIAMQIQGYFDGSRLSFIEYSFPEKVILSIYAFVSYILNILFPANLSATYPLIPPEDIFTPGNLLYFLGPLIFTGFIIIFKHDKIITFGLLFFLAGIGPVLDHSSVGKFIMADRFAYVASLGLILVLASFAYKFNQRYNLPKISLILVLLVAGTMFYITFNQCKLWKDQKTLFTHALTKGEYNPVAYCELGATYIYEKEYDSAENYIKKAIKQYPKYWEAYLNLGKLCIKTEKFEDALYYLRLALKYNPSSDNAVMNIGIVMLKKKEYHKALSFFNQVIIESDEELLLAYLNRAEAKLNIGDVEGAYADCSYYLGIDPDSPPGNFVKAKILEIDNPKEALKAINYTISLDSLNEEYYYTRAQIRGQKLGDLHNSMADLNKVIDINPDHYRALSDKGIINLRTGNEKEALICFNKSLELNPKYTEALVNRGIFYFTNGFYEYARADLKNAIRYGGNVPDKILEMDFMR